MWGPRPTDYMEGSVLLLAKGLQQGPHKLTQPPRQDHFTLPCRGLMTLLVWLSQRTVALFLKSFTRVNKPSVAMQSYWAPVIPSKVKCLAFPPFCQVLCGCPGNCRVFHLLLGKSYRFRRLVGNHSQQGHRMAGCMGVALTFTGFSVHTPLLGCPPFPCKAITHLSQRGPLHTKAVKETGERIQGVSAMRKSHCLSVCHPPRNNSQGFIPAEWCFNLCWPKLDTFSS